MLGIHALKTLIADAAVFFLAVYPVSSAVLVYCYDLRGMVDSLFTIDTYPDLGLVRSRCRSDP